MADPRSTLDWVGQDACFRTYTVDASTITYAATSDYGSASVGLAVTFTAAGDGTIKLTEDGEFVLGRLTLVESDGKATVQIGGSMKLPLGSGATAVEGQSIVGDLGAASAKGYVRSQDGSTAGEIKVARGFTVTDAADSDGNVVVEL